jgi:putative photosynthetic complex assembly protein
MSELAHPIVPQKPFAAIVAGLALTVMVIGAARLSGFTPSSSLPVDQPDAARVLKFEDADAGTVVVRDAKSGDVIQSFGVGEGAFLRATLRALVNDRRKQGNKKQGDFRLERHAGGQHYLIDEATGRSISLNAFGPDNSAVFAAFMSNQQKGEGL